MSFFILADKGFGITSNKFLYPFKKLFGKKIGHSGTLDPFATGLMVLGVNQATKFLKFLKINEKEYEFKIKFGVKTKTDDLEGEIIESNEKTPTINEIVDILPKFIGKIEQIPNKFSAIKINGERSYFLARKGEDFEVPKRVVEIKSLQFIENQDQTYLVSCSQGTYVRTLAKDISEKLNCIGCVSYLRRVKTDGFDIKVLNSGEKYKKVSLNCLKDFYKSVFLSKTQIKQLQNGVKIEKKMPADNYCAVDEDDEFCGMFCSDGAVIFSLNMLI